MTPSLKSALERLARGDEPRQSVNPGVAQKLERDGLASEVDIPSPFKTVKGLVRGLRITEQGRQALKAAR